jgi:CRISPR/Cas system CMR-associated protein Cmr1 (group 7 of RAMP superfamily)
MHGPKGDEFSELRPSAVKGVMRYWFRVFAGAGLTVEELYEAEAKVFGGRGDKRSRLSVYLRLFNPYKEISTKELSPLPHKVSPPQPGESAPAAEGEKTKEEKKGASRLLPSAIIPGTPFDIYLARDNASLNPALEEVAAWSLWLAVELGGFGSRMRRGAGSVSLEALSPTLGGWPLERFQTHHELAAALAKSLEDAHRAFTEVGLRRGGAAGAPTWPALANERERSRIVVVPLTDDPSVSESDVRSQVWLKLREYKNPAFGLPLKLVSGWVKPAPGAPYASAQRHSSPLWVHLRKLERGWVGVFTFLAPCPHSEVQDAPEAATVQVQKIHDFLDSFGSESIEVAVP